MKTFGRIVRWTAIAMVVVVAIYFVLTIAMPPTRYETRFEVDRPVDIAWGVFMDETRTVEWLPGLRSIETIRGEPGTVGSVHRMIFEEDGHRIEMEEEVVSVVKNREFAFRLTHEIMEADLVVRFEDLGERTRIVTTNEVRGRGLVRPLIPLMKSNMTQRQQEGYARLKAIIESE